MTYDNPERLYRQCYRYLQRTSGAQPFGFDWPTLRLTHPQIARVMRACLQQIGKPLFDRDHRLPRYGIS